MLISDQSNKASKRSYIFLLRAPYVSFLCSCCIICNELATVVHAAPVQILSASEGNILEDESAISIITEAKTLGNEISLKQKVAEETEVQIEAARTAYKPCGDYTAILFFCISGQLA